MTDRRPPWSRLPEGGDPDATFALHPQRRRRVPSRLILAGVIAAGLFVVLVVFLRPPASAPPVPGAATPVANPAPLAGEAALLAVGTGRTTLWRFADDPAILVMIFPSLHQQALTLDRIAEFVERAGAPHDRVLDDASLRAAIKATGDDFDTVYLGHDYRAADLQRFFATAATDQISLDPEELSLKTELAQQGVLAAGADAALISLPPKGDGVLDARARAAILRHELSHGLYFTDPAYNEYVQQFWQSTMTDGERAGMRAFLVSEGYDGSNEDLMRNEALAYLVHTADRRFFVARVAGMDDATAQELRDQFIAGMPAGWLRERTAP